MSKVDVVIPAYNAGFTIERAIRSVQSQTHRNLRVLIVDDGSTDDTREVVKPFLDRESVLYFYQQNAGAAAARNTGIAACTAPFVSFLDADDEWLPEMLESCVTVLEREGSDLVSVDNYLVHHRDGIELRRELQAYEWIERPSDELFLTFLTVGGIGGPHKAVFRRDVFERVGPFDASLPMYEDLELWVRIARSGLRWGHVRRPLVLHYKGSPNALSAANPKRNLDCRLRVILRHAPEALARTPSYRAVLADNLWNFGRLYVSEHRSYRMAARCFCLSLWYRPDPSFAAHSALNFLRGCRRR